ncbi:NAD-dependent epimerase/dehydratase family protein [Sphaerisporangium album]|uniref:NAD-dependent epimerase/dehydratase family protein n=1 Tax=Sphaerisporangium album TaxID=509200 RepID=A0A367FQB0_9ACTN|nr:NAD(P)H-binding protein [Sphaerisporangium album]RCG31795.1 NAD-dependent epimerase/dehydratase family protein [Sphaerisporangium album]
MTFLVTGATGTVGRHVVDELVRGGHRVRALTRRPERAGMPAGVEVVAGDLTVTDSLRAAFDGVTGVHLINFGGDDYGLLRNGQEIVDLAVKAGVLRVTVLGGWDEGTLEPAVKASSLGWTYVRPTEFMSNALKWAEPIRTEGVVREPFGDATTAMVHEADIAAVAAAALAQDGHRGRTYGLTGPERLTTRDKVRVIGEAIGRAIQFIELSEQEAREKMAAEGQPQELIDFLIGVFGNVPEEPNIVNSNVEKVTGRPARTFAQWAAEHADAFRP